MNIYQPLYNEFGEEQTNITRRELTTKMGQSPSYIELLAELYLKQGSRTCTCTYDIRTGEQASICSSHSNT